MTEEPAFSGTVRVVTKSYGILNDSDNNEYQIQQDKLTTQDVRSILLNGTKFVTSGNTTFLVGSPEFPYNEMLFPMFLDHNLTEGDDLDFQIWFPIQEIICMIPGNQ